MMSGNGQTGFIGKTKNDVELLFGVNGNLLLFFAEDRLVIQCQFDKRRPFSIFLKASFHFSGVLKIVHDQADEKRSGTGENVHIGRGDFGMTSHDVENGVTVNDTGARQIAFFHIPDECMKDVGKGAHVSYGRYTGFNGRYEILFLLTVVA